MSTTATQLMAFEEFEQLPDTPEELELLEGELIRLPPRKRPHMEAAERLYEVLKAPVEQLRRTAPQIPIGRVHIEMGYLLSTKPRSWLRPDVSITSPEQPGEDFYEGAPWMVFEIVWESDTATRLDRKVQAYLAHGAKEVWVLYPETRHAWVYEDRAQSARREESSVHSELLPGIEIPFDRFL